MAKINITISDELLERCDDFIKDNYLSRSGFFSFSAVQYLNQNQAQKALVDIAVCMRQIAENGKLDKATKDKLEKLEVLCSMLNVKVGA